MSERLEDLRDQSKTNELLKRYCDVQSTRIDLLEKRLDRLEVREDKVDLNLERFKSLKFKQKGL